MDTHVAKPFTLETLLGAIKRGIAAANVRASWRPPEAAQDASPLGAHLPVLDTKTLAQMRSLLKPGPVRTHLASLGRRFESLLQDLSKPDATPESLTALNFDVHALAGSAGMFGFERLVFVGGQYERDGTVDVSQINFLAAELKNVLSLSLKALHREAQATFDEQVA